MHAQPLDPQRSYNGRIVLIMVIGFAVLVAAVLLALRRPGQDWGGDFALYISHARNLVEGQPYANTGYIVDPYYRSESPATYPPLFPVVLAPLVARYGVNYEILKIPGILFFAATIPLCFWLALRRLPVYRALLVTVLWGAWPFILWFKDSVLPDLLFLLLWMLTIWVMERAYENSQASATAKQALLTGVLMFAAYATRSAGIVAPAALIAYDYARFRRISRYALLAAGAFAVLFLAQNLVLHSDKSYMQMFTLALLRTSKIYAYALSVIFTSVSRGWVRIVRGVATAGLALFALWGFLLGLRRFRSPMELMLAAYFTLLLLWSPGAGIRYFVPLVPFIFIYMAVGLKDFQDRAISRFARPAEWALMVLIVICYSAEYGRFTPGPIQEGSSTPGFSDVCRYIEDHTANKDVFIFENPRVLSLYTRRPAAVYPESGDAQLMWDFSRTVHARYLLTTNFLAPDAQVTANFLQRFGAHMQLTYSNINFRLYSFLD